MYWVDYSKKSTIPKMGEDDKMMKSLCNNPKTKEEIT